MSSLPKPVSASAITGISTAAAIRAAFTTISVMVSSPKSGSPKLDAVPARAQRGGLQPPHGVPVAHVAAHHDQRLLGALDRCGGRVELMDVGPLAGEAMDLLVEEADRKS